MIYYYGQPHPAPSGGMIVQLQHVGTLVAAGIPATFLVSPGYRPAWIDLRGWPVTYEAVERVRYRPEDVLVVPEYVVHRAAALPVRKVAHIQNWAQVFKRLDVFYPDRHVRGLDDGRTYEDLGYSWGLSCGGALTRILRETLLIRTPILTVTNYIDVPVLPPARIARNRILVSNLHAQGGQVFMQLWDFYSRLWGLAAGVRILPAVPRAQFLRELQEADIYLHLKYPEGLPLKPLEAMRMDCAVVGFAGGGGLEFMRHEDTALVAEDGDFHRLLLLLRRAIEDGELRERLRRNGREMAGTFTHQRFRSELLAAWKTILAG